MSRTKGAGDLPKRKRAQILAQKNIRKYTNSEIAAKYEVAEITVKKINNQTVAPDVLAMARKYERDFITYAEATAVKAQQRAFETINELNAKDAQIVAEKAFNISQLYHNRPTQITNAPTDEELFVLLFNRLLIKNQLTAEEIIIGLKRHERFKDIDESKLIDV